MRKAHLSTFGVFCVVLVGALAIVARPSSAVVIRGGDGSGNTTAPGDDPGWAYVGSRGIGGAVYLGWRWVLTAAHVGGGTVNFGGTNYSIQAGTWHRLHEPGNPGADVDLGLFQITAEPTGLSELTISNSAPPDDSEVLGVGWGKNRGASETWWNASWEEQTGSPVYRGFHANGARTKRWGENDIDDSGYTINAGSGNTYTLEMDFDRFGGAGDDKMQAVAGDSGGGLFYKNGTDWELAGILMAVHTSSGQPDDTAVYSNLTHAADLSRYRDQIVAIIPEPGTVLLFAGGLIAVLRRRRRRTGA